MENSKAVISDLREEIDKKDVLLGEVTKELRLLMSKYEQERQAARNRMDKMIENKESIHRRYRDEIEELKSQYDQQSDSISRIRYSFEGELNKTIQAKNNREAKYTKAMESIQKNNEDERSAIVKAHADELFSVRGTAKQAVERSQREKLEDVEAATSEAQKRYDDIQYHLNKQHNQALSALNKVNQEKEGQRNAEVCKLQSELSEALEESNKLRMDAKKSNKIRIQAVSEVERTINEFCEEKKKRESLERALSSSQETKSRLTNERLQFIKELSNCKDCESKLGEEVSKRTYIILHRQYTS